MKWFLDETSNDGEAAQPMHEERRETRLRASAQAFMINLRD